LSSRNPLELNALKISIKIKQPYQRTDMGWVPGKWTRNNRTTTRQSNSDLIHKAISFNQASSMDYRTTPTSIRGLITTQTKCKRSHSRQEATLNLNTSNHNTNHCNPTNNPISNLISNINSSTMLSRDNLNKAVNFSDSHNRSPCRHNQLFLLTTCKVDTLNGIR
jgi:hypothetical protein